MPRYLIDAAGWLKQEEQSLVDYLSSLWVAQGELHQPLLLLLVPLPGLHLPVLLLLLHLLEVWILDSELGLDLFLLPLDLGLLIKKLLLVLEVQRLLSLEFHLDRAACH